MSTEILWLRFLLTAVECVCPISGELVAEDTGFKTWLVGAKPELPSLPEKLYLCLGWHKHMAQPLGNLGEPSGDCMPLALTVQVGRRNIRD